MGIVRNPLRSLACVTCTKEGICDGVALAQIGVVRTAGPRVRVARTGKRIDSERYERDDMTRLADVRQYKSHSPRCRWTS